MISDQALIIISVLAWCGMGLVGCIIAAERIQARNGNPRIWRDWTIYLTVLMGPINLLIVVVIFWDEI